MMTCIVEKCVPNLHNNQYTKYPQKGIYVYQNYYDKTKCMYHIMLIGDIILCHDAYIQPQVSFRIFNDNGNIYYVSLDDNNYNYEICTELDYFKLKKFLEIEFMKLVKHSIQDNLSMEKHKKKRIELNTVIKFLDNYGPSF